MNKAEELIDNGFAIINDVYSVGEIDEMLHLINNVNSEKETFRKSIDLFAIRQFLREIPSTLNLILNNNLRQILAQLFGGSYFIVKSIYFDKPPTSNWYVSYHQDLTISVDKKLPLQGFDFWTIKQDQFAVQPPLSVLENIVTVRIHLDDTDENNGALKVLPRSHRKGIYRPETIDWTVEQEKNCLVPKGGIMLMKPLLLHSSGRTTNGRRRRVIHIEFCNIELPGQLNWAELINLGNQSPSISIIEPKQA